jgi:hypothetical protein
MAQLFNVNDDGSISIANLILTDTSGEVTHTGTLEVTGNVKLDTNLVVDGTITANTFNVQNLITPNGSLAAVGNWIYNTEAELNGKGFQWAWGSGQVQLAYRTGGRIWSSGSIDIANGMSYNIDNIPVLTSTSLGGQITSSNLTTVGTLNELNVAGDATIADFVYFNSVSNRIGVGTEEPNTSFSILDNNVEIGIGSPQISVGSIGTWSSHDLAITTDNLPRITIKATGAVNIGDPITGGGVLNVYGTLYATTVQSDNRIERTQPLQFNATADTSIYGLGLVWNGSSNPRQLIMMSGPDRLWTTESFDIGPNQSYYINGMVAINSSGLGSTIINSSLQTVGTLQSLAVSGPSSLTDVTATQLTITDANNNLTVVSSGINGTNSIALTINSQAVIKSNTSQTTIGDATLQNKPVKVFGPLSVNINNPDPSLQFSVNGDVNIGGKKFTNGSSIPATGVFQVGDICWNTNPTPSGYVGWICISAGTPGQWLGFGMIAAQ